MKSTFCRKIDKNGIIGSSVKTPDKGYTAETMVNENELDQHTESNNSNEFDPITINERRGLQYGFNFNNPTYRYIIRKKTERKNEKYLFTKNDDDYV